MANQPATAPNLPQPDEFHRGTDAPAPETIHRGTNALVPATPGASAALAAV